MLPDYPYLKDRLRNVFTFYMREHIKRSFPLQEMVKRQIIHEGTDPRYQSEFKGEFEEEVTKLNTYSAGAKFSRDELIEMELKTVFQRFLEIAENLGEKIELASLKDISEKLTEKGQTTKISKEITPDDILNSFESVAISFDENGKAKFPSIMAAPETVDKFAEAFKKLDEEPYLSKFRNLIEKKKKEWDARENSRKLVD